LGASINRTPRQRTIIPSGYPPIPVVHLAIRFLLEIAMLVGVGMAGWHIWRYLGAILFVAGAMVKSDGQLMGVDVERVSRLAQQSRDYILSKTGWPASRVR